MSKNFVIVETQTVIRHTFYLSTDNSEKLSNGLITELVMDDKVEPSLEQFMGTTVVSIVRQSVDSFLQQQKNPELLEVFNVDYLFEEPDGKEEQDQS